MTRSTTESWNIAGSEFPTPQSVEEVDALDALEHEAPYLIEKLIKDRVVDSADEGNALYLEVKRYLVLNQIDRTKIWKMHSHRVDEAWHEFVLFTAEYVAFCKQFFGHYVHHSPSNAPDQGGAGARAPEATFAEFADRYRDVFATDLPSVWVDSSSVTLHRRVLNDRAGHLRLQSSPGMVDLADHNGAVLFSVSDLAREALDFIARTGAFYVRELPGGLTSDEKVGLISTMVDARLLRVG
jgi:hypothetical protein